MIFPRDLGTGEIEGVENIGDISRAALSILKGTARFVS